jgi:predicted DsbA family dithiol-disulfide isomerase
VPTLAIDIWSDIACPWCWVGKRHLEAAMDLFEGDVALTWRAFELDPNAPTAAPERVDYVGRLAAKYRTTPDEAQKMIDRMVDVGRSRGLDMRFDRIRPTNTFDAHRLLAWAASLGKQTDLKERLFSAYLHEGLAISDPAVLTGLAADVALDAEAARAVLASDAHAEEVRADEALASQLDIRGVPFFVLDRRFPVSGAQPPEALLEVMHRAVDDGPEAPQDQAAGEECGPEGCDLDPGSQ